MLFRSLLSRGETAGRCLDFEAGEHGYPLPDHLGGDDYRAPADEISGAASEAELHGSAGAWIGELTDLVTEQAEIRAGAKCEANALLDFGLSVGHARYGSGTPSRDCSRAP